MEPNLLPTGEFTFTIPADLLKEFKNEVRIVIRHPWVIGIPAPDFLFKDPSMLARLEQFEVMLVPKDMRRL
ncbi:MAG: hypothetical protein IPM39_06370 [Chloroflexi bacterium]|nr:hypothetical protein [Chloroflexota bacterium]